MTLKNDFYSVVSASVESPDSASYTIALNPTHIIFKAHFPGNPITPGVCQLRIVEELASQRIGQRLRLAHITNIKYMNIISPLETPQLSVHLSKIQKTTDGNFSLQVLMNSPSRSFTKLSLCLTPTAGLDIGTIASELNS